MIPYREYRRLAALAEDAEGIRAFDESRASDEHLIPAETVHRLIERKNPIKVLGISRAHLAKAAGVRQSYIAMLERGERQGSVSRRSRWMWMTYCHD